MALNIRWQNYMVWKKSYHFLSRKQHWTLLVMQYSISYYPNKTNFYGFPYSLTMFHSHKSDNKDSNRWPYLSGICCHELQISCWLQKLSMAALPKKDHFPLSSSFAFKHLIISANCWQIWYRYFYVTFNLGNSNEPLKLIWLPLNWTKGAKQSDFYCCD